VFRLAGGRNNSTITLNRSKMWMKAAFFEVSATRPQSGADSSAMLGAGSILSLKLYAFFINL